jgi:hypothetical protein
VSDGSGDKVRIGTSERELAINALADHLSAGRLELTEYEQRCGFAAAARTRGELLVLFDDLPAPHPTLGQPAVPTTEPNAALTVGNPGPGRPNRALWGFVGTVVAGVLVVTVITKLWWTLLPVLVLVLIFVMTS